MILIAPTGQRGNRMYCFNCMNQIGDDGYCPHCQSRSMPKNVAHHLRPGTVLGGKYLIGNSLGEGGFGITYIGRDLTLDVRVAVKEYYPSGYVYRNNDAENVIMPSSEKQRMIFQKGKERFLQEARSLAKFSDEKGVVLVRDYFESGGSAYIVMEYLDGITLQQYLKQHKTIEAETIFRLMLPIISSLERMHSAGIIHRDISPDNIMYLRDGSLKLMDFGSARFFTNGEKEMSVMIKQGYAPEEQYRRNGSQGPWTDVYGLCATIYKCVTGIVPDDSLNRLHYDSVRKPSELGVRISPLLENTLMYGLAVDQINRCRDMTELKKLVTTALENRKAFGHVPYNGYQTELKDRNNPSMGQDHGKTYGDSYYGARQNQAAAVPEQAKKEKKSALPIVIAVLSVILVAGIGGLIFALLNNNSSNTDNNANTPATSATAATLSPTEQLTEKPAEKATQEPDATTPGVVKMPDLIDMDSDSAVEMLEELGLSANCISMYSDTYSKGQVFKQNPKEGEEVDVGAEVVLYVSDGPEPTEKPKEEVETKTQEISTTAPAQSGNSTTGRTLYCRTDEITLRDIPSRYGNKVAAIKMDESVTYIETVYDFYKVKYNGKTGYVLAEFFSENPDAPLNNSTGNFHEGTTLFSRASGDLHLRVSPSTSARSIATIGPHDRVTLISLGGEFDKIEYNGQIGYVLDKFLTDNPDAALIDDES